MAFEIGMGVVCIKTHSRGISTEGKTYTILNIKDSCCSLLLDLGTPSSTRGMCNDCHRTWREDGAWWEGSERFVPLDSWEQAEEAKESLLEELNIKV